MKNRFDNESNSFMMDDYFEDPGYDSVTYFDIINNSVNTIECIIDEII